VPIVVKIGAPIEVTGDETPVALTAVLHERLTKLSAEVQAAYPAPASDEDSWWQPAALGGTAPTLEAAVPIEAAALQARHDRKRSRRFRRR
jgi:hypothetical protein